MTELGDESTPGSFMGVFNAQTFNNGGALTVGSIENEIVISQSVGGTGFPATAIPLAAMLNSRAAVGGTIYPPFQ